MSAEKSQNSDYQSLRSPAKNGSSYVGDQLALKPFQKTNQPKEDLSLKNLRKQREETTEISPEAKLDLKTTEAENFDSDFKRKKEKLEIETVHAETPKQKRKQKKIQQDFELLSGENWLRRNGHTLSYIGLYAFSVLVLFRPYELIPSLSFLAATAFYLAAATILIYVPTQFAAENSLTAFSTEVKCVLALLLIAFLTIPIAKDPPTAWATFSDNFIKAILMFIVMINVVRTRERLLGLLWISLSIGIYLSYTAVSLYMKGEMKVEGYRVGVEVGGLFGNPNDMALHLVTMIPLAVTLGIASRNKVLRFVYFAMAGIFIAGNMVSFSRGGFIGLLASSSVLVWKLGRSSRLKVTVISAVVGLLFILLAPGNYGLRLLSIFIPALDPVGSSDQRKELLILSIIVTLRNPWGIGIGNFPIVGIRNLVTHNSFTQVSSELGILGLIAYVTFLVSPFRKLGAIERTLYAKKDQNWFYYLSIGLQASIIGYMFSSFFVAVAYNWFVYYLIAYAVAFRRVYNAAKTPETNSFNLETI